MNRKWLSASTLAVSTSISLAVTAVPSRTIESPSARLLVSGLQGGSGSTIGPDGALYVTERATGTVVRVDPRTGATRTFASGLPPAVIPVGGAMDVEFVGRRAYVLVTLVADDVGGNSVAGIYRMEGPNHFSVLADIGTFARNNPSDTPFDVPTGVQYAMQFHNGAFLVTDGHHNRVLRVTLGGRISVLAAFGNIVPTGLATWHNWVFMGEAGATPHTAEDGKAIVLTPRALRGLEVASGAPLLVDIEFGPGQQLFALSQGDFPAGEPAGSPALPNTGALMARSWSGEFTPVVEGLNQPTSLEFIDDRAYVVTLGGEIWVVDLD